MSYLKEVFPHSPPDPQDGWGYDFRRNMSVGWGEYGEYATDLFTTEAVRVIQVTRLHTTRSCE